MKKIAAFYESIRRRLRESKHPVLTYIGVYTALFCLCSLIVFFWYIVYNKSFVWNGLSGNIDGLCQHYTALSYWGSYLRGIVRTLFTEGRLVIPMIDTSIGMGSDVINTLSYYVIGDPLTLFSALVPRAYTEYLYNFLILLRLWLAGLSFSALAFSFRKNNRFFTLLGSMIYVFSGYAIFASVRHPYFSNPLIYFPLVLLGVEYIFKGKKPWLFIIAVMLSAVSNFYFFYMIVALTVVYVLIRMFDYAPKGERKKIWGYLVRFAVFALIAVLMAAVLLYPAVRTIFSSNRSSNANSILPILYDTSYYQRFIYAMPTAVGQGFWDYHGLIPLSMLAIVLLWYKSRKQYKTEKRLYILSIVFLLVPFFAYMLNGFNYAANRWVWGYTLLVSMLCTLHLDKLRLLSKRAWGILFVGAAAYTYGAVALRLSSTYYRLGIFGLLTTILVLAAVLLFVNTKHRRLLFRGALVLLLLLQLGDFSYQRYIAGNYIAAFVDSGKCYENVRSAQSEPLAAIQAEQEFCRYEDYFDDNSTRQRNATLVNGGHSTNAYFSLSNDSWFELQNSLGHLEHLTQEQQHLDHRAILGTLANVKYYTVEAKKASTVKPFGYSDEPVLSYWQKNPLLYSEKADYETPKKVQIHSYENENALPFGYTYDSYITREEYDKLFFTDKQTALLHNAVLDEPSENLKAGSVPQKSTDIPYSLSLPKEKMSRSGNTFTANEASTFTLHLSNIDPEKETYLSFSDFSFTQYDAVSFYKMIGRWEDMLPYEKRAAKEDSKSFSYKEIIPISITCGNYKVVIDYYTPYKQYYTGADTFCVNLGRLPAGDVDVKIKLPCYGVYNIENLKVTQLDISDLPAQSEKLGAEHLENVRWDTNRVTGNITVSENKLLCLSLPNIPGWRAFVDGEEVEILSTDLAFMGLELTAGEHQIELRFVTPYLLFGAAVSVAGWGIFILMIVLDFAKSRKKKKEGK